MSRQFKLVETSREVIENRLLSALETDSSKVAILCSEADLQIMIDGLNSLLADRLHTQPMKEAIKDFIGGLQKLKDGAFGR